MAGTKRIAGLIAVLLVLTFAGFVAATAAGFSKLTGEQFNLVLVAINGALAPVLGFYFMASDSATGQRRRSDFQPPAPPAQPQE